MPNERNLTESIAGRIVAYATILLLWFAQGIPLVHFGCFSASIRKGRRL